MKTARNMTTRQVMRSFKLTLSLLLLLLTFRSSAHTVVLAEHKIEYKNDMWVLSFIQKTSHLRDAIYIKRPDLKGKNLNSDVFHQETSGFITANFSLKHDGKSLKLIPYHMQYGGLMFNAQFYIEGLPKDPDYLTIETSGFDTHEHSVKLLSIILDNRAYVHYFDQVKNFATFSFDSKHYDTSEFKTTRSYKTPIYIVVFLTLLIVVLVLFWKRKGEFKKDKKS